MIASDQQWDSSSILCEMETIRMNFQPTEQQIFSLVLAKLRITSKTDENLGYSKRNSLAQKWFVCVRKHIATLTQNQTNSNLAGKACKKELLKTVVMAPCPNIAKFWKLLLMYRQQVEVFAQYNMLEPHFRKQRKDFQSFNSKEMFKKMEPTFVSLKSNYRQFNIMYQYFWVTDINCFSCHL